MQSETKSRQTELTVELEAVLLVDGDLAEGLAGEVLGLLVVASGKVDRDEVERDALLERGHQHALGAGGEGAAVELCVGHFESLRWGVFF